MCGETMCSVFVNFCAQPHCLLPSDVKNWWEVVEKLLSQVLAHMLPSSIPHLLIVRFGSPHCVLSPGLQKGCQNTCKKLKKKKILVYKKEMRFDSL